MVAEEERGMVVKCRHREHVMKQRYLNGITQTGITKMIDYAVKNNKKAKRNL